MEKKVSAIIPAFNEEGRISRAVSALKACQHISEIIVVDDGSTDATSGEARALGVSVITVPHNLGKGNAMRAGVAQAQNEVILFCDADMYGFTGEGIEAVIAPVLSGTCDMSLGIRPKALITRYLFPFLTQISGFRALSKKRWREIPSELISGYQVELAVNFVARRNDWEVAYTKVPGLGHSVKEIKYGIFAGLKARSRMFRDIFLLFLQIYFFNRKEEHERLKVHAVKINGARYEDARQVPETDGRQATRDLNH